MNKKYIYFGVIALLAVFGASTFVIGYTGEAPKYVVEGDLNVTEAPAVSENLGAMSGPDFYQEIQFFDGSVEVNRIMATTSSIEASTLSANEIIKYDRIEYSNSSDGGADGLHALTLPASSTMKAFLQEPGSCTNRMIVNTETIAASSTTITAGTGVTIQENTNNDEILGGGQTAVMKWCRNYSGSAAEDFSVYLTEFVASD